jgi:hypothetical protein
MASGIFLPAIFAVNEEPPVEIEMAPEEPFPVDIESGIWTPPQYSQPALTILSVVLPPYTVSPKQGSPVETKYVFDAVFRLQHNRRMQKTSHPVLTGANISDHAYLHPAKITLEIGMSDCMASFSQGIWTGYATKSISAWQTLKALQQNRRLITLTTRLDTYNNMLIISIDTSDDNKTKRALKATVVLEELLSASVITTNTLSAREQSTGETAQGTVQATPPNAGTVTTNVIPSDLYPDVTEYPNIPGAGNVSSNSLSQTTVPFF